MILLTGFFHRDELLDILERWLMDRPRPGDTLRLKQIVNFNVHAATLCLDRLASELLGALYGCAVEPFHAYNKGQLKDYVAHCAPASSPRVAELVARYFAKPEEYFRETPFRGCLYHPTGAPQSYLGSTRIKRFRRIAEKGSRRIADALFATIRGVADEMATARARELGIDKAYLVTSPDEQISEFVAAERRVVGMLRGGALRGAMQGLRIDDVIGLKVVAPADVDAAVQKIACHPRLDLIEREEHCGVYNATNLILDYSPDMEALRRRSLSKRAIESLASRGLVRGEGLLAEYDDFLASAEPSIRVEVIISTYEEMLESEIGRCMHEQRIVEQRNRQEYRGALGRNVAYLMEYMLALCLAPRMEEIADIPIKLWVPYMPDYFDTVVKDLFGIPVVDLFDVV